MIVKVPREDSRSLLGDYSKLRIDGADAILDVVVTNYGYVTEHFMFSPHWRPEARVFVAMAKPMGAEPIYQDEMMYGYHNPFMSVLIWMQRKLTNLQRKTIYLMRVRQKLFLD